jgi:lipopolysaccharide/colanic/teichoic acid biosynthesis glycosyltransferase
MTMPTSIRPGKLRPLIARSAMRLTHYASRADRNHDSSNGSHRLGSRPATLEEVRTQEGEWHARKAAGSAYRAVRTVLDWVVAILLLVVCSPLLVAIAAAVRIDSEGPVLFRQHRVGKDGKRFSMIKFRTMQVEAPAYSLKVAEHSPDITRVGRMLRRSGLDELPQLWNVVRGEMAIIGPRPEQAELIHLYEPWQHQRHVVRPGITGWWQVHHRDGIPLHHNVEKDLHYIRHQGPWIDLVILLGTFKVVLTALLVASVATGGVAPNTASSDELAPEGEGP